MTGDIDFKIKVGEKIIQTFIPIRPSKSSNPREHALQYLDPVFVADTLKDDIVTRTAIPDLLGGTEPGYAGVILYGPAGTGKTVLLEAIGDVYRACGAYAKELSESSLSSPYVSMFAKNIEHEFILALKEAKERGKPSFLGFDEASALAQDPSEGANTVSKLYQETLDVMKRYIGNQRTVVVGISTNLSPDSFDEALTREGRLTSFLIDYPDAEQRKRMLKYFAGKHQVLTLTDEQASQMAEKIPAAQGAFIEEFCRTYRKARATALLKERGHSTLVDALKHGARVTADDVTRTITFDTLRADLEATLRARHTRDGKTVGSNPIGFNPNTYQK